MPRILLWTACVVFLVTSQLIGADADVARPEQFVFFRADREQIKNPLFLNTPGFAGAQISYSWKELEPEKDRYDTAIIARDLAFLRANRKKLFIQIQDVTFDAMSADVPDYLRMDPQYKGGANQQYTGGNDADGGVTPDGWVSRRWDPAVAARFARLLSTLGKEFDGRVEGINLAETSVGFGNTGKLYPSGFTPALYRDAIKRRMKTARDAFPTSAVLIYANFMPGEWLPNDDKGYLKSIFEYADQIGVGVGGPDLQPFKKGQLQHSYPLIRDRKKGILAGVAVQEGNYAEQNPGTLQPISVPELYAFAKDTLHLDYIFWCTEEPFFSRDVVPFATRGVAHTSAGSIRNQDLQAELHRVVDHFDGRVGVCVEDASGSVAINGTQSFPLQSVMKLVVGMAVMDAVDKDGWRLDERVVVHKQDLSLYVQPIAKLVTADGFQTTVGDLVRRNIVDSDSAAADILVTKLGGSAKVQAFLDRKRIHGVRFDRDEKHLQTEIVGLEWRPEYVDPDVLQRATDAVPKDVRDAAYRRYQADPRDTSTPEGMASLLQALASGQLLSAESTKYLLEIMAATKTFPDRLKAGLTTGWTLGHKTGTSGSWEGVTAATNDVGIFTAPDGGRTSVVVFIADSHASDKERAALMARISESVINHYVRSRGAQSSTTATSQ